VTTPQVASSLNAVLKEADALIGQERWSEALAKLESVKTTDPSYLDAQRKIQAVRSEMKCIEAKPEILRLIAEENFAEVANVLKGIPAASNCAEAIRLEYETKLVEFCDNTLKLARETLEDEGPEQAKPIVDRCLLAMPTHQEALQLAETISTQLEAMGEKVEAPESTPVDTADSAEEKRKRELARRSYDQAIRSYLNGEISSAISSMRKIDSIGLSAADTMKARAAKALKVLDSAKRRYEAGKSYYSGGNTSKAYSEWNAFLADNKQLDPSRKGTLYRDVADKMTATYCRFASEKYKKDEYADAFGWWWKAKQVDPDNADANEGLGALEKHAIKKYREGYMLVSQGSVESAATCFKEVTQVVPESHAYYIKAQKKLVEIGR
jgi:tetratricopeptide (TPR) repeat protein